MRNARHQDLTHLNSPELAEKNVTIILRRQRSIYKTKVFRENLFYMCRGPALRQAMPLASGA